MDILSRLFYALVAYDDLLDIDNEEYLRMIEQFDETDKLLTAEISEQANAHLNTLIDAADTMSGFESEAAFTRGFLLGARIMLTVTGKDCGHCPLLDKLNIADSPAP